MNTKRLIFWTVFFVVLALIVWGLAVAMNKPVVDGPGLGKPAEVTADDHIAGAANATVTIIEYSDFQCPACKAYYPLVEKLVNEASTTVRLVYRHYPLPQHKNGQLAARVSEAAANQGKFWDMYTLLFENQESWSPLTDADARGAFLGYAERLGLDTTQFTADIDSDATKARVRRDMDDAIAIGVNATPTFFVNGKPIQSNLSYEQFKQAVETAASNSTR